MNTSVVIKIFENSESKQIDICSHGQFSLQFSKTSTKVKDLGNGTISVFETERKCTTYIDCHQISSIWVGKSDEQKESAFID